MHPRALLFKVSNQASISRIYATSFRLLSSHFLYSYSASLFVEPSTSCGSRHQCPLLKFLHQRLSIYSHDFSTNLQSRIRIKPLGPYLSHTFPLHQIYPSLPTPLPSLHTHLQVKTLIYKTPPLLSRGWMVCSGKGDYLPLLFRTRRGV